MTEGSTTVSGILVPDKNVIYFGADCTSRETDWMTLIPDYMLKTVTAELEVTEQTGRFPDVTEDDFYYESVEWIAEQGITLGYDDGLFHPDDDCDRAQAVTFLYRATAE